MIDDPQETHDESIAHIAADPVSRGPALPDRLSEDDIIVKAPEAPADGPAASPTVDTAPVSQAAAATADQPIEQATQVLANDKATPVIVLPKHHASRLVEIIDAIASEAGVGLHATWEELRTLVGHIRQAL